MFCLDDGTRLTNEKSPAESATLIMPADSALTEPPTRRLAAVVGRPVWRSRVFVVGALVTLALVGAIAYLALERRSTFDPDRGVVTFPITVPEKKWFVSDVEQHNVAISPDGRKVVFTLSSEGKTALYLRSLDQLETKALAGTDNAFSPFWSPDSRSIAFFSDGKLRKIDSNGGSVQTICDVGEYDTTATWGADGTILFVVETDTESWLEQVNASGGSPTKAYGPAGLAPMWPQFLPDGKHFLFYGRVTKDGKNDQTRKDGFYVGTLGTDDAKLVFETPRTRVEYAAPGYILYVREGSLLAQQFDLPSLSISGAPSVVVEKIVYFDKTGYSEWSVSQTGALVFPSQLSLSRLAWLDRNGRALEQIGSEDFFADVRLAPDGTKIAVSISDEQTSSGNIWLYDLKGSRSRLVFGPLDNANLVWSPDGQRIAFFTNGRSTLRLKDVSDVAGDGETPIEEGFISPTDWSRDGRYLIYSISEPTVQRDIWILPFDGDRKPFAFLKTQSSEWGARFSPDSRYVAFNSNESGTNEIYVAPLAIPEKKVRISASGGSAPRWSRNGRELFYLAGSGPLMAVKFSDGIATDPVPLFDATKFVDFDVSLDGQKFLVISSVTSVVSEPLNVMLNWTGALRK